MGYFSGEGQQEPCWRLERKKRCMITDPFVLHPSTLRPSLVAVFLCLLRCGVKQPCTPLAFHLRRAA